MKSTLLKKQLPGANWVWYTVFFGILVFMYIFYTVNVSPSRSQLSKNGVSSVGMVVDKGISNTGTPRGPTGTKYLLSYEFSAPDVLENKEIIQAKNVDVTPETWGKYRTGSRINITYLESKPNKNLPTEELSIIDPAYQRPLTIFGAIGLFFIFMAPFYKSAYFKKHKYDRSGRHVGIVIVYLIAAVALAVFIARIIRAWILT